MPQGRMLLDESLALYTQVGDEAGLARVHWALGSHAYGLSDYATARHHVEISLPIFREIDDRFSVGWALHLLGLIATKTGDFPFARAALREGLSLFAEAGDVSGIGLLLDDLSGLAVAEDDGERAARLAGGAAALQKQSGTDLAAVLNAMEGRSQAITTAWNDGLTMPLDRLIEYALAQPN